MSAVSEWFCVEDIVKHGTATILHSHAVHYNIQIGSYAFCLKEQLVQVPTDPFLAGTRCQMVGGAKNRNDSLVFGFLRFWAGGVGYRKELIMLQDDWNGARALE